MVAAHSVTGPGTAESDFCTLASHPREEESLVYDLIRGTLASYNICNDKGYLVTLPSSSNGVIRQPIQTTFLYSLNICIAVTQIVCSIDY